MDDAYGAHVRHARLAEDMAAFRKREYARLPEGDAYVDQAGAAIYPASLARAAADVLLGGQGGAGRGVFGNPHSRNPSSLSTSAAVEDVRRRVLAHVHAPRGRYSVVFCAGTTAGAKLLADAFPWTASSVFAYAENCHTSLVALRNVARMRGAASTQCFRDRPRLADDVDAAHLVVLPAMCNFSGAKRDALAADIAAVRESAPSARVLVDAAALASTGELDLEAIDADYAVLSFYKMVGLPTGLGALIIRNDRLAELQRTYAGGGTVAAMVTDDDEGHFRVLRPPSAEQFEDGTVDYLGIAMLRPGLELLAAFGMRNVHRHCMAVARRFRAALAGMTHAQTGVAAAEIYGRWDEDVDDDADARVQGPIVTFNVRRSDGSYVGFSDIDRLAALHGIHLRVGCFCNTGACHAALGIDAATAKAHHARGHVCGDEMDVIDGTPTGAVRVSFGLHSTHEDADAVLDLVRTYFVDEETHAPGTRASIPLARAVAVPGVRDMPPEQMHSGDDGLVLHAVNVFPVKACRGFSADRWALAASGGLEYDRQWCVVDAKGMPLTQKRAPMLARVQTAIHRAAGYLVLSLDGDEDAGAQSSRM